MGYSLSLLFQGKAIFTKLYTLPSYFINTIPYSVSPLPGYKEGISTGILTGYNIGVDGNIPKEKIDAAITAVKFLSSKEIQKKYFLQRNVITSIPELYDDPELCQMIDCEFYKNIQFTVRPSSKYYAYSDLYLRIEKYVYEHLYGNQTAEVALKNIENLTKIHYLSFTEKEAQNKLSLSIFILVITLSILMASSLVLLFTKKLGKYFNYLTKDSWIISIFGLIVLISTCYTTLGPMTDAKCHLYVVLIVLGYTFNVLPILHKLIVNFPDEYKICTWIKEHKYGFFILFVLFDFIVLSLFSFKIYDVEMNIIEDGENFEICKIRNLFSLLLLLFILASCLISVCTILILCYIEWGLKTYVFDVHIYIVSFYMDAFCIVLLFIFEFIPVKNYTMQFLIKNLFTLIPVISSYLTMYGFRLYLPYYISKEKEFAFTSFDSKRSSLPSSGKNSTNNNKSHNLLMKIKNYHNQSLNSIDTNSRHNTFATTRSNTTSRQNNSNSPSIISDV